MQALRRNYLTDLARAFDRGCSRSTTNASASCTLAGIVVSFFLGGVIALLIRAGTVHTWQSVLERRSIQRVLHAARRDHDVPVFDPQHSSGTRQLSFAGDARCEGRRFPSNEPRQLLPVGRRGDLLLARSRSRWTRYGLDLLHAVQHDNQLNGDRSDFGRVHSRFQFDLHRSELRRDHQHDASEGHDLVQDAVVALVALCNFDHPATWQRRCLASR